MYCEMTSTLTTNDTLFSHPAQAVSRREDHRMRQGGKKCFPGGAGRNSVRQPCADDFRLVLPPIFCYVKSGSIQHISEVACNLFMQEGWL